MDPLTKAERYLRRAEECIALAKAATSNKVRAHHYAIAERYVHLAQAEPTVANQGTGSARDHIPAPSATS
jgi:type II secretory pathway component HofQ